MRGSGDDEFSTYSHNAGSNFMIYTQYTYTCTYVWHVDVFVYVCTSPYIAFNRDTVCRYFVKLIFNLDLSFTVIKLDLV